MREFFLRTERLGFGLWSAGDLDLAMTLWGDAKVSALLGGPFSPEQVEARLRAEIEGMEGRGVQYWPVFALSDGDLVGCAGLRPYGNDEGILELGIHLRPGYWRQGIAEEAARAVIGYGFGMPAVKAIFAGHHPANAGSRRLMEKLGFRYTGEEYYPPMGMDHPSYLLTRF